MAAVVLYFARTLKYELQRLATRLGLAAASPTPVTRAWLAARCASVDAAGDPAEETSIKGGENGAVARVSVGGASLIVKRPPAAAPARAVGALQCWYEREVYFYAALAEKSGVRCPKCEYRPPRLRLVRSRPRRRRGRDIGSRSRRRRGHDIGSRPRRRRGHDVCRPWGRVAATRRPRRVSSVETSRGDAAATTCVVRENKTRRRGGHHVDRPWRRTAATPRPRRGSRVAATPQGADLSEETHTSRRRSIGRHERRATADRSEEIRASRRRSIGGARAQVRALRRLDGRVRISARGPGRVGRRAATAVAFKAWRGRVPGRPGEGAAGGPIV